MKLAIGSTKAGLTLKKNVIEFLEKEGYMVDDLGMKEGGEFVPYYESAAAVAEAVSEGKYEKAIIICGTGAGSVIVANKFKGAYAVQASSAVTVIVVDPSVSRSVNGWRRRIAAVPYAAAISPTVAIANGTAGEKRRAALA